jgi:hypothetical protein
MDDSPSILVKWPSRSRPERFFTTLDLWCRLLSGSCPVYFLFSFDREDVMAKPEVQQKLALTMRNFEAKGIKYSAVIGPKVRTKVQACNADVNEHRSPWDLLILSSDDMVPKVQDFDLEIMKVLPGKSPVAADYAICIWDGWRKDRLCTLPVMTRLYYERFGYVYHPSYESLWCDNEQTEVARVLGRMLDIPAPTCLVEHQHPVNNRQFPWDELYRAEGSNTLFAKDKANFEKRRAAGAFNSPMIAGTDPFAPLPSVTPVLTIMVPTLVEREGLFKALMMELQRQCLLLSDPTWVEVIWQQDSGEITIGAKRQKLLETARGEYVCSVDDDDLVEPSYIRDLLSTIIRANPPVDCVVFEGRLTCDGRFGGRFDFDLCHKTYKNVGDLFLRTPNHLCPIRREIALAVGYKEKNFGEDSDYAQRIFPKLSTQAVVKNAAGEKKVLYHYRYSPSGTRTQRACDKAKAVA